MSKNFIIILLVIVGAMVGIFALSGGKASAPKSDKYSSGNILEAKDTDHTSGVGNKGVTFIEYGDFECPACGQAFPLIEQMRQEFGDDITFVFRHFPITGIHPNAMAAHRSAEAAGKQGKFFEMYELLYANQQSWNGQATTDPKPTLDSYAESLGINMEQYQTDYSSEETNARISADLDSGKEVDVSGTPTIFINGDKQDNTQLFASYESLKKTINDYIAKASQDNSSQ